MSDERKLSERFAEAAARYNSASADDVPYSRFDEARALLAALAYIERERIFAALRRDEDPRRAIADRLLAICEEPNTEQRYSIGAAAWNDHNDGEAAGEAACAALLALAKGTAP
jgi:hypothetical protein